MKWIYDTNKCEFYEEDNPAIRVNLNDGHIYIGSEHAIHLYCPEIVSLYSRGDLTVDNLIKLSEYERILNAGSLNTMLINMISRSSTFADIETLVEENTEFGKHLAFEREKSALIFSREG